MRYILETWPRNLFGDAVWFHINGYENSQNNRYWCAENCMLVREAPLRGCKVGVWCAVSATRIIGLFFFLRETVNLHRCDGFFYHCPITTDLNNFCFQQNILRQQRMLCIVYSMFLVTEYGRGDCVHIR